MLFTRIGYAVAVIALMAGIFGVIFGVLIATGNLRPDAHTWPSGKLITYGTYEVLVGIALGILAEIRYALRSPEM